MLVIKAITKRLTLLSLSFALVVGSNVGRADDIEIYFNSADAANNTEIIRSNVLFILDSSSSMKNIIPGTGRSRIDALKDAMTVVLNSIKDVNVGLMRFNKGEVSNQEGGPVIFPIKNIDGNVQDVVGDSGENIVTQIVNTAFLRNDLDDGEEVKTTHNVTLTDAQLDAFDFGGTQSLVGGSLTFPIIAAGDDGSEETRPGQCFSGNFPVMLSGNFHFIHRCRFIGLRFAGVSIPQGTAITSAHIDLRRHGKSTGGISTTIVGQDVDHAAPMSGFGSQTPDISSRVPTTAAVDWSPPNFSGGKVFSSTDIAIIVQEIVDRPGWASGQAMFFRFQDGAGSAFNNSKRGSSGPRFRRFRSRDNGSGASAPKLRVIIPSSGTEVQGDDQLIALRFTNVVIPQGAALIEAKLTVTPSSAPVNGIESIWKVSAEQTDNSAPLTDNPANISSRDAGGTVNWVVDSTAMLEVDESVASVDLKNALH
jgi:type IV pilus assembly protein PilY1